MNRLADFDAIQVAEFFGGTLLASDPQKWRFYKFQWGRIEIYENGGEVNVYFEYLRGVDFQPPTGVRISQFSFNFSIPYTGCDEAEFAARLLFYLRKAAHGVDLMDYFVHKKEENSITPTLIPVEVEGVRKLKCDCSRWWELGRAWSIYLNKDFEFEVYYNTTLFGCYKSLATALKRLGVTQLPLP
jgi:hypothetical protein